LAEGKPNQIQFSNRRFRVNVEIKQPAGDKRRKKQKNHDLKEKSCKT